MVELQPDDHPHIQDLLTWAEGARRLGTGGAGLETDRPFIPVSEIEAYFQDNRPVKKLLAALFPHDPPQVDPETIRKNYAKVFLILVLTGNGRFIVSFVRHDSLCDRYLPFTSRPARFPPSTANAGFFESFYHRQWEFCAPILQYGMNVQFDEKDLILPIIYKKKLGHGGSSIVHKIELHPAYNKLGREAPSREGSNDQDTHTFVLKTYNTPDAERYYQNEVSGFLNLNYVGGPNANIIGFHGSFVRDGTYNVLLEYADRGTLEQYFDTIQPPSSGEDTIKFWRGLFKTFGALVAIHSVQPSDSAASSDASIFQGWHQDIKPSNILVKSKNGGSDYDCEFKLADLGLSHFKKHVPSQGDATDRDTYGTRAYGAPECYRADSDIEKIRFLVKQNVDIWSLGCTLSEAAVWVVHGKGGLKEYRRRRGIETARIPGFRDGNCFHDGREVLATVMGMHRNLPDDIRPRDHVSGTTVDMVTKQMLIEANSRTPAKSLSYQTKWILEDAESKLKRSGSYTGTGSNDSRTGAQSPPRTPPEPPPGHVQSRSSNSHSQHLPSHKSAGSPASISYDEDKAHHQEPVDDFVGKRASRQVHYSDRPTRQQSIGLVSNPSYSESEDQYQIPENRLNRAFTEVDLSQDNPSSPSWQEPQSTHRKRRRTTSDLFSGANTRNGPHMFSHDRRETYDLNQRDTPTAPPGGVSRASTATLVQDRHNGSRGGQHHPNIGSGMQHPRFVSIGSSNVPPPIETRSRQRPPSLSLTDAQQWKKDKKEHRPVRLPHDDLLADLNERDHVFLIDNSLSMRPYRREVENLFGLLGYIVKGTDPDGIEIQFTMSRDRKERAKNTGQLLRTLETVRYVGTSNIRIQLGDIFQDYHDKLRDRKPTRSLFKLLKSPRPVRRQNLYIFTDGIWQPGCDPAPMIKKLVGSLEQNFMEREQFGIQFIRFGNDPDGINRLNQLDSGLGLSMDIVDTEHSDGNVWKMLLGAVNDWFDDDDVNADSSAVASPVVDASAGTNGLHHFERRPRHT